MSRGAGESVARHASCWRVTAACRSHPPDRSLRNTSSNVVPLRIIDPDFAALRRRYPWSVGTLR